MMSYNLNLTLDLFYILLPMYIVSLFWSDRWFNVSSVKLLAWLQTQPTRVIKNRSGAGRAPSSMSVRL